MVSDVENPTIGDRSVDDYDDDVLDTAIGHDDDEDGGMPVSVHHHSDPDLTDGAIDDYAYDGDTEELAHNSDIDFNSDSELAMDESLHDGVDHILNADSRDSENHQAVEHSELGDVYSDAQEHNYVCVYCLSDSQSEDLSFVDLGLTCGHEGTYHHPSQNFHSLAMYPCQRPPH